MCGEEVALLQGRKMRTEELIKFNSLAIYIGVGFAAVGRNALAKGKSKYDLTKLEGEAENFGQFI